MSSSLILPEITAPLPRSRHGVSRVLRAGSDVRLQVTHTIPKGTYRFAPEDGITTILETYKRAFARAKRFIYIENQYLWRRTFMGFENPALGLPHPEMEELFQTLAEALARGVVVALLLPDNPNVGREFTDEGINYLWELAPHAAATGALQTFTLASSLQQQDQSLYRSIYVHAKLTIVDDAWVTVGSANLNNRGMCNDTEMNVALIQPELARRLRIFLMAEHLGLNSTRHPGSDVRSLWQRLEPRVADPYRGLALLAKQAKENFQAIKTGQPLVGHVFPYIPHNRAQDYGVDVNAANGWLDALSNPLAENATMVEHQGA